MKNNMFDSLEQIEILLSQLYARFAAVSHYPPDVTKMFLKLSEEEISHRDLIRFQRRIIGKNPSLLEQCDFEHEALNELISRIKVMLESKPEIGMKDALIAAIEFELESAENHFKDSLRFEDTELSKMMKTLGKADRAHRESLVNVANEHGVLIDLEDEA